MTHACLARFRDLRADRSGATALEFAMVAPLLAMLLMGCFEICYALQAYTKLNSMTQDLTDLIARNSSLTVTNIADICVGGQLMMSPFNTTGLSIAVASVTNTNGIVATDWHDTSCGGATAIADPAKAVTGIVGNANDSAIVVQATYPYKSPLTVFLPATFTITETAYDRPRNNKTITHQ